MDGIVMEKFMILFLEQMGFKCPKAEELFTPLFLETRCKELSKFQWRRCEEAANKKSTKIDTSASKIADSVYKVDTFLLVPQLWALQFSTNFAKLEDKQSQLIGTDHLRKGIGVEKTILMAIRKPSRSFEGFAFLSQGQIDRIEEKVYDLLEVKGDNQIVVLDLSWL